MKKLLVCLLVAMMVFSAVGCGGKGDTETKKVTEAKDLKIAMLLPSSPTDGGWGQIGATALNNAKNELGCEGVIVEAATADLMKSEATSLAEEGYNIIFGHGGQYASPFGEIASKYPDTVFITSGGSVISENQMPVLFAAEKYSYIEGAMAAKLSKTGVLGTLVGGEFPAYTKTSRAFELGAKSVNPNIKVLYAVTQDSSDMNEGYEITMSQINEGADIICPNANQATLGAIQAAKEKGIYIFGAVADATNEAPDLVVASWAQDFSKFCVTVADKYLKGELKGEAINIEPGEEGLSWIWNDKVKAKLSADVVGMYDELLPQIMSDKIHVPGELEGWD